MMGATGRATAENPYSKRASCLTTFWKSRTSSRQTIPDQDPAAPTAAPEVLKVGVQSGPLLLEQWHFAGRGAHT